MEIRRDIRDEMVRDCSDHRRETVDYHREMMADPYIDHETVRAMRLRETREHRDMLGCNRSLGLLYVYSQITINFVTWKDAVEFTLSTSAASVSAALKSLIMLRITSRTLADIGYSHVYRDIALRTFSYIEFDWFASAQRDRVYV